MHKHYGHRFRVLHCCTDQIMTEALAQMDLTSSQGRIVGYLARQSQPPCCRDIEDAFHLSHPTVSGILSRLEKKGFLAFQPDPSDHRCKRIILLPKGLQCHQQIVLTIDRIEHQIVQDFTPEEQEQFFNLLDRAIRNMGCGSFQPTIKEESQT